MYHAMLLFVDINSPGAIICYKVKEKTQIETSVHTIIVEDCVSSRLWQNVLYIYK